LRRFRKIGTRFSISAAWDLVEGDGGGGGVEEYNFIYLLRKIYIRKNCYTI